MEVISEMYKKYSECPFIELGNKFIQTLQKGIQTKGGV